LNNLPDELFLIARLNLARYSDWLLAERPWSRSSNSGMGKIFLLSTSPQLVPVPTQPPIQWVPGGLPPEVKRPGVKLTVHFQLVPRSRIRRSAHPLPHVCSWRSASLVKHRDNFTTNFEKGQT
jgi:hypothetical protein